MRNLRVHLVAPACNEEDCLPLLLDGINRLRSDKRFAIASLLVVDNACTDHTARIARSRGATVLFEPRRGYGAACLRAHSFLSASLIEEEGVEDIVVFIDADGSDFPEDVPRLLEPLAEGNVAIVFGNTAHPIAGLPRLARYTKSISLMLLGLKYGSRMKDIGRYRAITWRALKHLQMEDRSWGWPLEMQLKALRCKVPYVEMQVGHQQRPQPRTDTGSAKRKTIAQCSALLRTLSRNLFSRDEPKIYALELAEAFPLKANA